MKCQHFTLGDQTGCPLCCRAAHVQPTALGSLLRSQRAVAGLLSSATPWMRCGCPPITTSAFLQRRGCKSPSLSSCQSPSTPITSTRTPSSRCRSLGKGRATGRAVVGCTARGKLCWCKPPNCPGPGCSLHMACRRRKFVFLSNFKFEERKNWKTLVWCGQQCMQRYIDRLGVPQPGPKHVSTTA